MTFQVNSPPRAHFFTTAAMLRRRASPSSRRQKPRADPPSPPLASSSPSPTQSVRHFITLNNKPYPDVVNGFNSDEDAAGRHGVYHYLNRLTLHKHILFLCEIFCSFSWFSYFCANLALCLHYSALSSHWSIRTGPIISTTNSKVELIRGLI